MQAEDVARNVAAALTADFGPALKDKTERAIKGTLPPPGAATRSIMQDVADLAAIAHFICAVAPVAMMKWNELTRRAADRATLRKLLADSVAPPSQLSQDSANKVIDAVVAQMAEQH